MHLLQEGNFFEFIKGTEGSVDPLALVAAVRRVMHCGSGVDAEALALSSCRVPETLLDYISYTVHTLRPRPPRRHSPQPDSPPQRYGAMRRHQLPKRIPLTATWRCWSTRFFFQAEDGIRDVAVTGVQTCALPI